MDYDDKLNKIRSLGTISIDSIKTGNDPVKIQAAKHTILDNSLSANDWSMIIAALKKKAIDGDVRAAKLLLEYKFGKAQSEIAATPVKDKNDGIITVSYTNTED